VAISITSQAAWSSERVSYGTGIGPIYGQSAATIIWWFKHGTAPTSGDYPCIFEQFGTFARYVVVNMVAANGGNQGKFQVSWRPDNPNVNTFVSTTRWDDNAWHWAMLVRRNASPYTQLYIDGVSDGSDTDDPGTDATALNASGCNIGNEWNDGLLTGSGFGGSLARFAMFYGITMTVEQGKAFAFGAKYPQMPDIWLEFLGARTADYSKNQRNATLTGTPALADHPFGARWHRRAKMPLLYTTTPVIDNSAGGGGWIRKYGSAPADGEERLDRKATDFIRKYA
jgi:hypothetical protein